MKKSFICLFAASVVIFSFSSCGGKKAKEEAAKVEEAAVAAGSVSKSLLTEELKQEVLLFLKDMPDSDIPNKVASGEIEISVGDMKYMLAPAAAADLTTKSQKARALGIYLADFNLLTLTGQPTKEVAAAMTKLVTDLNITFVQSIINEELPKGASAEESKLFYHNQEDKLITAFADNDKMDVAMEVIGGLSAQYACVYANPSLVVKGDATSAGLSENMERRFTLLLEVAADLSEYYPDLKTLGIVLSPMVTKVSSISTARNNNSQILAIRDQLLK
ncbi:hypothetical protein LJC35_05140 [Parabacteroides sp. OttesenSCG-928-N08]|nr:hypothetical protein [Parabacteroides sp. OttesenSCG-928-N08]